jgi:glycine C-acetyltransferase
MYGAFREQLASTLDEIRAAGLYKNERQLTSAQSAHITTAKVAAVNFCANNYLGLANHPTVVAAASTALQEWGFGMASVRFICGTQTHHAELESKLSSFLGTEATILYSSCCASPSGCGTRMPTWPISRPS